jgi:heat shock protein HtpX
MSSLYTQSDANQRNSWILISVFFVFIIIGGYLFSAVMDSPGILYFAVIFSIFSSFFSYWYSDKMVLAMSDAKEIDRDSARELYRLVENLCITAGLPLPKIYVINDTAPNAFATGRDPEHAVVAVTTGLVEKLSKSELEGVIAHELSHIGNRDILFATLVTVLVGIIVLLADWFRRWTFWGRSSRKSGEGQLATVMFILAIIFSILAPIFAYLMQFAISRKREFLADADGALLTRYPEGLASALEKISVDQEPLEVANRATAHLYIVSPFKSRTFSSLFSTHPPVADRIAALRGMEIK